MARYVDQQTLSNAISQLKGTANVFFRIWLFLKKMGFTKDNPVEITTINCGEPLKELFWYGDPESLFTPFTETPSDWKMAIDSGRSIIQTNLRQWADKTGTKNPVFLDVREGQASGALKPLIVRAAANYPEGLGVNATGFAVKDGKRVSVPPKALAVWIGRTLEIPDEGDPMVFLVDHMNRVLNISPAESLVVFVDKDIDASFSTNKLTDEIIREICNGTVGGAIRNVALTDTPVQNRERIQTVQTINGKPSWLNAEPSITLEQVLKTGAKAILLYGPPRTGKTRAIDILMDRDNKERETIQIHDGWDYEQLIQGLFPKTDNTFDWKLGRLTKAIVEDKKKFIVLEEINRTLISQSLGEVFSLIEDAYRGKKNAITLRSGDLFYIPEDVVFVMTMNTVDKSTEDVDDALIGRLVSVEFPPRVEDLYQMLEVQKVDMDMKTKLCRLFSQIQEVYPLGHGYFSQFRQETNPILFFKTKIRPVLFNHLAGHNDVSLGMIDNLADELFAVQ